MKKIGLFYIFNKWHFGLYITSWSYKKEPLGAKGKCHFFSLGLTQHVYKREAVFYARFFEWMKIKVNDDFQFGKENSKF